MLLCTYHSPCSYIIRNDLLKPVLEKFAQHRHKNNMINSAVLSMIYYVARDLNANHHNLISYVTKQVTALGLDSITYVSTFKELVEKCNATLLATTGRNLEQHTAVAGSQPGYSNGEATANSTVNSGTHEAKTDVVADSSIVRARPDEVEDSALPPAKRVRTD